MKELRPTDMVWEDVIILYLIIFVTFQLGGCKITIPKVYKGRWNGFERTVTGLSRGRGGGKIKLNKNHGLRNRAYEFISLSSLHPYPHLPLTPKNI